MKIALIAICSIALSVAAQFCLKAGVSGADVSGELAKQKTVTVILNALTNRYVALGFLLYGASALIWLAVLARWDVSKAYPLVGLGFAFTAVIGLLLGEQVSIGRGIGIVLIVAGVWLVGQS